MNQIEKKLNNLSDRLYSLEAINIPDTEEYDRRMEAKFAKLREARTKKTDAFGNKTYEDVWDEITDEELDYYKEKWLRVSPEERYIKLKNDWYCHESSWYARKVNGYDNMGCNQFSGCVPECRYFQEQGRIEDKEVENWYKEYKEKIGDLRVGISFNF